MKISKKIFDLRKNRKLTIRQLSAGAGVATGTLSDIENGKHFPSLSTLLKLSRFYNVNIYDLLGDNRK